MSVPRTQAAKRRILWTVDQVARFLQVSKSWVYKRHAAGELPGLRFGGHLRFEPGAMEAEGREAIVYAVASRYMRRVSGHLSNVATAVINPVDQLAGKEAPA